MPTVVEVRGITRPPVPVWPTLLLSTFATLATVSIMQGVFDIAIPTFTGAKPFGFVYRLTEAFGPSAFGLYIFLHNLGLACLVPGFGFVAVRFEKKPANRAVIGMLLAGAVVLALLVALEYLVQSSARFDLRFAIPLFVGEAVGVLALALPAARELRGFVPTPRYEWSLVTPLARLRWPFLLSALLLAALSGLETLVVLRA
jgi:hypothetical protein